MADTRPGAKKRPAQAQGIKALITAAAVAATLGGWAALSTNPGAATAADAAGAPTGIPAVPTPLPFGGRTRRGAFSSGSLPSTGQQQQPFFSDPRTGQFPAPSARTRSSR